MPIPPSMEPPTTGSPTSLVNLYTTSNHTPNAFFGDIVVKEVPNNLDDYDTLSKTIFSNYTGGASLTARYVSEDGTGNGSNWDDATNDLQGALDSISDASANNIYVVLIASGTYQSIASYSMKNHVAIIGGFNTYSRTGETRLGGSGQRGVFTNSSLNNSALLYGLNRGNFFW